MSDPEAPRDRDDGLRRGSQFEPADQTLWDLPDQGPGPRSRRQSLTDNALIIGIVILVLIIGLLVVWIL